MAGETPPLLGTYGVGGVVMRLGSVNIYGSVQLNPVIPIAGAAAIGTKVVPVNDTSLFQVSNIMDVAQPGRIFTTALIDSVQPGVSITLQTPLLDSYTTAGVVMRLPAMGLFGQPIAVQAAPIDQFISSGHGTFANGATILTQGAPAGQRVYVYNVDVLSDAAFGVNGAIVMTLSGFGAVWNFAGAVSTVQENFQGSARGAVSTGTLTFTNSTGGNWAGTINAAIRLAA
jgi:hypothetical protein